MDVIIKLKYLLDKVYHTWKKKGLLYTAIEGSKYTVRKARSKIRRTILKTVPDQFYLRFIYWWNTRNIEDSMTVDPFRRITVDPNRIQYCSNHDGSIKLTNLGKVKRGNWDKKNGEFTDTHVFKLLEQRYDEGHDWYDIQFIQDCLENRIHWSGATTEEEIRHRCDQTDQLFESISTEGYYSNCELNEVRRWDQNSFDEIVVDIGRDGELLFVDGRHRLSIAQILDIDKIPVQVSVRHESWALFRKEVIEELNSTHDGVARFNLPHPDLQDIPVKYDVDEIINKIDDQIRTNLVIQIRPDLGLEVITKLNDNGYDCMAVEPDNRRRAILEKFRNIRGKDILISGSFQHPNKPCVLLYEETVINKIK